MERKSSIIDKVLDSYDESQLAFKNEDSEESTDLYLLKQLEIKTSYFKLKNNGDEPDTRRSCSHSNNCVEPQDFDPKVDMKKQVKSFLNLLKSSGAEIVSLLDLIRTNEELYSKIEYHASDDKLSSILCMINNINNSIYDILQSTLVVEPILLKICNDIHLDGEEIAILIKAYLEGKGWDIVAEELYMSERKVFLLNTKLIDHLAGYILKQGFTSVFQLFNSRYDSNAAYEG